MREKKEINIQIGEQVRLAREKACLTQEKLSEMVAVSPQYISDLERGVVGISIATLKKICCILSVTSDEILFGTESSDRTKNIVNKCSILSDKHITILSEIIDKYIEATQID